VQPIEKILREQLCDVSQTIEAQEIVHHNNSWRLQSVYCYGGAISLLMLMFSPVLGVICFAVLLFSLFREYCGAEGWIRGFTRKQIGVNYLIWNCSRFPKGSEVTPIESNPTIIALQWNQTSEKYFEANWFVSSLLYILYTLIFFLLISIGWVDSSIAGVGLLLLMATITRFIPPSKPSVCFENISLAKKMLADSQHDNFVIVLFDGSSSYDSLCTFLQNYASLFNKEQTRVLLFYASGGHLVENFHISQRKKALSSPHSHSIQYIPFHRPTYLGWNCTCLQGSPEELLNIAHQESVPCSSTAS
jgi:hypothetical protein